MQKHVLTTTYKTPAGSITVKNEEVEGDLASEIEREGINVGETVEFTLTVAFAKILAWALGCKNSANAAGQTGDCKFEIKTNSTSSPGNTFTIDPRNGKHWSSGGALNDVNPITANVTALFVKNTGTKKGDFAARFLIDATPNLPG